MISILYKLVIILCTLFVYQCLLGSFESECFQSNTGKCRQTKYFLVNQTEDSVAITVYLKSDNSIRTYEIMSLDTLNRVSSFFPDFGQATDSVDVRFFQHLFVA